MSRYLVDLRVALFQLNPQIGKLDQTIERSWRLVNNLKWKLDTQKHTIIKYPQLIVFPEFALTGYSFHSTNDINPYITTTENSKSFKFAQRVSNLFNCYTILGYPEEHISNETTNWYNSAMVVDPQGELIFNYRKSFLYDTEYEWDCKENPNGFQKFPLTFEKCATTLDSPIADTSTPQDITLNASIGICMDLNPYKFEAPFNKFEFASFNLENDIDLIICPMAWLHSQSVTSQDKDQKDINKKHTTIGENLHKEKLPPYGSQDNFQYDLDNNNNTERVAKDNESINSEYTEMDKPDMNNVNYWLLRFLPFLNLSVRKSWYRELASIDTFLDASHSYIGMSLDKWWEFANKNAVVLISNRCGVEDNETIFAGSSGIFKFNGKPERMDGHYEKNLDSMNESVELLGNLGKGLEGVLMRDIQFEIEK